MLEKRKQYIDQLLNDLRLLEERVSVVKINESLPFSFFRESFDKIQEIAKTLHLLEFMQIDDMRGQMERIVNALSETESKLIETESKLSETVVEKPANIEAEVKANVEATFVESDVEVKAESNVEPKVETFELEGNLPGNQYARGIVLPEYRNPNNPEKGVPERDSEPVVLGDSKKISPVNGTVPFDRTTPSLNDVIPTQPAVVDLKRNLSLNDRFLFQRELFGNDRQAMNDTLQVLGTFNTYEEAEQYIRESLAWDFNSPTVSDFLQTLKNGFK